jgi:hypothetical protein
LPLFGGTLNCVFLLSDYIVLVTTDLGNGKMIDYHYETDLKLAIRTAKRLKGKVVDENKLREPKCHPKVR